MINKVILIGALGADPVCTVEKYSNRASFSIATNETYVTKSGDNRSVTQWHDCVIWGKQADFVSKYCTVGSKVYVEGSLEYWYQDLENGKKVKKATIKVFVIRLLSDSRNRENRAQDEKLQDPFEGQGQVNLSNTIDDNMDEEDLPF